MKEHRWVEKGSNVLDPFGGVGLGALYAITEGINWTGIEIEPRFHALAMDNISLWNANFRNMNNLGSAQIILGDSRYALMPDSQAVLSSPPYAEARIGQSSGQEQCGHNDAYGGSLGQLGSMKAGEFSASVSSPPYGDISQSGGTKGLIERGVGLTGGKRCFDEYGSEIGQLGRMKMTENDPDTFWAASKMIVTNVFNALAPGGHAVWVVKDYVKARKLVPFCEQWRSLCESCGFVTEHKHRSWMVQSYGSAMKLEGGRVEQKKSYKSFFRTLNETKGLPPIDYEIVWCMVKPNTIMDVNNG